MPKGTKPISGWIKSTEKSTDRFDREDISDQFRKKTQEVDALTKYLKSTSYFHKMRWPWLVYEYCGLTHPLDVDRYYHEPKVAIDFGQVSKIIVDVKSAALEKHGIKYIQLENERDLKTLAMGLS